MITFLDIYDGERSKSLKSRQAYQSALSSTPTTPRNKLENEQLTISPLAQSVLKQTTSVPVELFPDNPSSLPSSDACRRG